MKNQSEFKSSAVPIAGSLSARSRPRISQRELQTYKELEERARQVAERRKALREDLLAKLGRGAVVERGAMTVRSSTRWRQNLTPDAIVGVLGMAGFGKLCQAIPRTPVDLLIVESPAPRE